jgi:hypothetical protein
MTYFDPRLTEAYRKDTAHGFSSSGLPARNKCKKCGADKHVSQLVKKGFGSRLDPCFWLCKGGCNA